MLIYVDTREKPQAIKGILRYFDAAGIEHISKKLDFGDYYSPEFPGVVVDRKQTVSEIVSNVGKDHARFMREIRRCHDAGCRMVILCEDGTVHKLDDIRTWRNPRLQSHRNAMTGTRLYNIMQTIKTSYNVIWAFCDRSETGSTIEKILRWNNDR